ncbi:DUF3000 domain-containing protein [Wenjunlia vitaminophila]|uniref:DUF3000 domain-containing protein n=1 Tax=Wenjunlia vitaminophila TaxID=76728 RepID=UPI0003A43F55|nr:DUF3000 domain-containing protein [Wenjunlia vitaminophila]
MAAVSGHFPDGNDPPLRFQRAVDALRAATVRPEVELTPTRPPARLATYAYAVTGTVQQDGAELADGRLVLLHEPAGQGAWHGTFRLVTLVRADLEPEMAADPLLAEVGWSWLTGALQAHGAAYEAPSGTVSRCSSHYFGGLGARPVSTTVEIRASWTPREPEAGPDLLPHLAAWCDLLCASAGLPPATPGGGGGTGGEGPGGPGGGPVVPMPSRRGPRR